MRILLFFGSISFAIAQHGVNPVPVGAMHVEGNHIVDSNGHRIILRGGVIPFDSDALSPTTFTTMRQRYNMNALRLPVPASADLTRVATIVKQANSAGLVVILTGQGEGDLIAYWRATASYFKNNPMMIFDARDAPRAADWYSWLHGSDSFMGMQTIVNAIRSTAAPQIIAVQGFADTDFQGFNAFVGDPDIVYEIHPWFSKDATDADRDRHFGFLASQVPLLAGAWGFLPGEDSANCRAVPSDPEGAEEMIEGMLDYFETHEISWTYSTFQPGNLYIDYSDYYRTDLTSSWTCDGTTPVGLGIGETIQYYLDGLKEGDLVPVSGAAGNIIGSARGSVVHIYGYQMSDQTAATTGAESVLGGISVEITDSAGVKMLAPLLYVSPYLVNAVIPETAATGMATFRIGALTGPALIVDVQPGLFTGPTNGRGPAIGYANGNPIWRCDTQCSTLPIGNDAAAITVIGAGLRNARGPITAAIGGFDVPVLQAGIQDGSRGIDEVDLAIPDEVRGLGETDLLIFVDGTPSNAVRVNLGRI